MREQWADVPDSPAYQVSDAGNVRRVLADGSTRPLRGTRNRKPSGSLGYRKVCLQSFPCAGRHVCGQKAAKHQHRRQEYVHRLVWLAFRGPIPDDLTVDHIDGDKVNNRLGNLQLLTAIDNAAKYWGAWRDDAGWGEWSPRSEREAVA